MILLCHNFRRTVTVTSTREQGLGHLNESLLTDGKPVFQRGLVAEYKYLSCTHTAWLKLAHVVQSLAVVCAKWMEQTYWQIRVRSCNIFTPSFKVLMCQCRTIKETWGFSTQTQCSANPLRQSLKLFMLTQTSCHMNLVSHKTCRFLKLVTSFVIANSLFYTDGKISKTTAACLISVMKQTFVGSLISASDEHMRHFIIQSKG
jgi:hypothetical protein